MTTIYVASSWRNDQFLDLVHEQLHERGFETFDFRKAGRWWEHSDSRRPDSLFGRTRYQDGIAAFERDYDGMKNADACFAVLPSGESLMLEVGWFAGAGKPVVVWGRPRSKFDIMWLMVERAGGLLVPDQKLTNAINCLVEVTS